MKKAVCMLVLFLIAAPGSVCMAATLPALHLSPDCGYVFNPFTGTPRGFDALMEQLLAIIQGLGLSVPVSSWQEADLEMVGGHSAVGDGIPDYYQLAMLGAALCTGDPVILGQFNHNIDQFNDQVSQIMATFNTFIALPPLYDPAIDLVDAWIPQLQLGSETEYMAEELSWALHDTDDGITNIATYSTVINTMLPMYANWFAAIGGLDSGLRDTLDDLLAGLIEDYTSSCPMMATSDGKFSYTTYVIDYLTAYADPPMPQDLADRVAAIRTNLNTVVRPQIASLHLPDMVLFGIAKSRLGNKASSEPFAADGDYNNDGITNQQAYDLVKSMGGDRAAFVKAAGGSDPFWAGNPSLPVAGPIGLLLLAAACAFAGGRSARRI